MMRIAMLLVISLLLSCEQQKHDYKEQRFLLGTIVQFTVYGTDDVMMANAVKQAADVMVAVEDRFTVQQSSENSVQQFNAAAVEQPVRLDEEVHQLLLQSLSVYQLSDGAFDVTLGQLNQLWGFSGQIKPTQPPQAEEIKKALESSGMQYVKILDSGLWIKTKQGLKLDFGAIAKGLAIDKGIEQLKALGVAHAVINAGGDIRLLSDHGGLPWKVAVRHPRNEKPLGWVEFSADESIVTSGDYERFFDFEGKRYHHILDPKTGYPSMKMQSVTVIAGSAAEADALSTALFVLDQEKGLALVESLEGVEALWVNDRQELSMSSGMQKRFHLL